MIVDAWTIGHAAWGLFFAWRKATFWMVVAFAFAWEWFENTVLAPVGWGEQGNHINSVVDVAVAVAACGLAVALRGGKHWRERLDAWDD